MKNTNLTLQRAKKKFLEKYPNGNMWYSINGKRVNVSFQTKGKVYTYHSLKRVCEKLDLYNQYFVISARKPVNDDWGQSNGNVEEIKSRLSNQIVARYENDTNVFFVTQKEPDWDFEGYSILGFDTCFDGSIVKGITNLA